jgi:long-chain acyl-CoA synthetase
VPRFDLDDLLQTIHNEQPTIFPAVPTIYTAINNHPKQRKFNLSSIKYCVSGGAPLPVEVKSRFEAITGCKLVEGYGLTESSPVVTVNPPHGTNKAGSIGLPLPGTRIDLRDPDTRSPVDIGEKGEIWVKGPQVMAHYHNRPEDTQDVMDDDGWCRTGDIGRIDGTGYVYIVDRIKDVIIAGGYNIYPRHVEEAIYDHIHVEECIVAGVPDEYRGETVKAWIKRRRGSGLNEEELRDFLTDKLSKIEIPKQFDIRDTELPKTMVGKLSRKAVLEEEVKNS